MGRSFSLAILFITVLFAPHITQGLEWSGKKYRRELASLHTSEVEYEEGKVARILGDYHPPTPSRNKRPGPPPDTRPEPTSDSDNSPDPATPPEAEAPPE